MNNEKKMRQLEAARNFGKALHDLRCAGVRQEYYRDEMGEKITMIDQETGAQIGQFASAEILTKMTGQIIDEFALSDDYFGDLVKDDPQITVTERIS